MRRIRNFSAVLFLVAAQTSEQPTHASIDLGRFCGENEAGCTIYYPGQFLACASVGETWWEENGTVCYLCYCYGYDTPPCEFIGPGYC